MTEKPGKKIRIAHIAGGLVAGGVESVVYNYFSKIEREDYDLIYICYNTPDPEMKRKFEDIGFRIYELPRKREHFLRSCAGTYKILKENCVQIVHSNMTLMCFVTNIIGRLAGAKVLISHSHLALDDKGMSKVIHGLCKWLSCVTATDFYACGQDASDYLFGRKNRSRVTILFNAIDLECYRPDLNAGAAIRKELGLRRDLLLGHIGRFTDQKNHTFLLKVFHKFEERNPGAHMVLVGDGPLFDEIQRQSEEDGLKDKVIFLGSRQDVPAILSAMDLLLFPSLYEGLPVTLLEAQAAEVPVLASDGVDKKVNITGNVNFLSLEDSPEIWAMTAEKILQKTNGVKKNTMKGGQYDIRTQVQKLDRFYRNAVNRA